MGLASPHRLSRSALGPTKAGMGQIRQPAKQVGEVELNALYWTAVGAGLCADQARILVRGTDGGRIGGAEMWNPDDVQAYRSSSTRTGTGTYVVTFPNAAPDEAGTVTPIIFRAATVMPQSATTNLIASYTITGNVVTVKVVRADTNALVDATVLLGVW